jgi:NAD(P)-dependent dehydrogenase (short-subunit alcohol dehydrogenase family)
MEAVGHGRVAVVTGTTSGIGTEIGRELARLGFTVAMHGRDRARTEAVVADVRATSGNPEVHPVVADLAVRDDVRKLSEVLLESFPAISVLVNNAAVVPQTRRTTADGLEEAFAVNVLAPHQLGKWLRPALLAGAPARVVTFWGGGTNELDLDDLQSEKVPFDGWKTYVQSKNAIAALTLATAAAETDSRIARFVTVPGLVDTPGMRTLPGKMVWFSRLFRWFMRSPAQGARTPVWLATAPELAGLSGKAYGNMLGSGWRNPLVLPPSAADPASGRRLLELCDQLTP